MKNGVYRIRNAVNGSSYIGSVILLSVTSILVRHGDCYDGNTYQLDTG
jgi:hypothetical protein